LLKTHWRIISRLHRISDNAIFIVAFFLSYHLRDSLLFAANNYGLPYPVELPDLGSLERYFIVLGIALPLFNAFLSILGAYRSMRFSSLLQLLRMAVLSSGLVFLCVGSFLYLLKLDLSRSFVSTFCLLGGVGLFLERSLILAMLRFFRVRGKNYRNLLIVGTGVQARRVYLEIIKQPELGVKVAGFVRLNQEEAQVQNGEAVASEYQSVVYDLAAREVANTETFEETLKKYAIDEVLFTNVVASFATVHELAQIAVEEGVRVTFAADLFSLEIFKSEVSYVGAVPLVHYEPSPGGADSVALVVKRGMDLAISSTLLVLLSPLLLLVAVLIKLDSPGPVFFRQRRVGLNGRVFVLLKFRSMVEGAEKMLADLKAKNEMKGPVFKIRDDPRVTRIGRFIRRLSIDELPQLINVLRGDMSLVGPRPPLPKEVSMYMRKQRRRLSMRPGLTCIWQVSGRNEIPDFEQWAKLDLQYIDNWSLWTDFRLLVRTIPAVLSGSGAR
jgi:exopolysaccharide biosynthesis polyprenyl glycosylphosphotransferase